MNGEARPARMERGSAHGTVIPEAICRRGFVSPCALLQWWSYHPERRYMRVGGRYDSVPAAQAPHTVAGGSR